MLLDIGLQVVQYYQIQGVEAEEGREVEVVEAQAIAKYLSDGLFLAKLDSPTNATKYADFIHRQQIEILRVRFPGIDYYNGGVYPNTAGLT